MAFEWDPDYVPGVKLGLHSLQIIMGFVVFVLEIILFRSDRAKINANNAWPFGLCFLSIVPLVYLVMAPRFQRTQKLAQPYVMVAVDCIFCICWISAFASQAAYNSANSCGSGCTISKVIVAFAFFDALFWAGSSFVSFYTAQYYKFNDKLPGYDRISKKQNIDPDKAAFSMAPHDDDAYAPLEHSDDHEDDPFHKPNNNSDSFNSRPMYDTETEYASHGPAAADNPYSNHYETETHYTSAYGGASSNSGGYAPPAVDDYHDQPAQFPSANYDRGLH